MILITCITAGQVHADPAMDATVLIYGLDGEPKGAGVLVSPTGTVLTARHVVDHLRVEDAATGLVYYRLKTQLRRAQDTSRVDARLIALHPYLDVAVLQAEFASDIVALKIAAAPPTQNAPVVLTGHRLPAETRLLFNQTSGAIKDLDRSGLIVINTNVPQGYSGGPLVKDGELLGLIRSVDPMAVETFVLPVPAFASALAAMGVALEPGSYAKQTGKALAAAQNEIRALRKELDDVAAKMDRLQDLYEESQTEVSWIARLQVEEAQSAGEPPKMSLELTYEKARTNQPDLVGYISATAEPIYDDEAYRQWSSQHPGQGRLRIDGFFDERQPSVLKPMIHLELRRMAQLYYGNLDLPLDKLRGFQIQSEVEFVTADNSVTDSLKHNICFALVQSAYERGSLKSISERGEQCLIGD